MKRLSHEERTQVVARNLKIRRLQRDEISGFCAAKAKNVSLEKKQEGWGDVWTRTGIDADIKLCVSFLIGGRSSGWAMDFVALHFMHYNFCRVHKTLRVTPAMEAGIADHVWTMEELILRLLPANALKNAA